MKDRLILAGSLVAGLLASSCCIGPLVLGLLGLGSLGLGAALEPLRPWFLVLASTFLALGFYLAYRPRPASACAPGEVCAPPPMTRRGQRIALWVVSALAVGLATYPQWGAARSQPATAPGAPAPASVVTLRVAGMTCGACAASVEKELRAVPGVHDARVDYRSARAVVELTAPRPASEDLVAAVARAGYSATSEAP